MLSMWLNVSDIGGLNLITIKAKKNIRANINLFFNNITINKSE